MVNKKWGKLELRELILLGLVVAIKVVFGRFALGNTTLRISLGFIGSVMLGYYFGPLWGSIGGGLSDLITTALFGNSGGFFIGFTLSAMLEPFIYGCFFYQKPVKIWRIIIATVLVTALVDLGLNTLWLHLLYGIDFKVALMQRLVKELISPIIQVLLDYLVLLALSRVKIKR